MNNRPLLCQTAAAHIMNCREACAREASGLQMHQQMPRAEVCL